MPPYTGIVYVGPRGNREATAYAATELADRAAVQTWLDEKLPAAQQWVFDRFSATAVIRDGENIAARAKLTGRGRVRLDWLDPAVIATAHQPTGDPDGDKRGLCTCGWPTDADHTERGANWTPDYTLHVLFTSGADVPNG